MDLTKCAVRGVTSTEAGQWPALVEGLFHGHFGRSLFAEEGGHCGLKPILTKADDAARGDANGSKGPGNRPRVLRSTWAPTGMIDRSRECCG
jgi:hypothetical protein